MPQKVEPMSLDNGCSEIDSNFINFGLREFDKKNNAANIK